MCLMKVFGELTIDKLEVPYIIVFAAGTGHVVEQEGPPSTDEEEKYIYAQRRYRIRGCSSR